MSIRVDDVWSESSLQFLKQCCRFVRNDWQHAAREPTPDQGFEIRFRESCVTNLKGWSISQEREMHLGDGLDTASGVSHEVDVVARDPSVTAILEMKNRQSLPPEKNDVIVFFAKILDYLALNPIIMLKDVCPAFMSTSHFDRSGLAACLGLGIHPITPDIRPVPILVHNARMMDKELQRGVVVDSDVRDRFDDYCARLNNISSNLTESWFTSRCDYRSDDSIVLRAVGGVDSVALSQQLRQLSGDCSQLIKAFAEAKSIETA